MPKPPNVSDAYPGPPFVAPVSDIIIGAHELSYGLATGIGAGVLFYLGPENWIFAILLVQDSPIYLWDGGRRIWKGIHQLGERNCD